MLTSSNLGNSSTSQRLANRKEIPSSPKKPHKILVDDIDSNLIRRHTDQVKYTISDDKKRPTLNEKRFISLSNKFRCMAGMDEIECIPKDEIISETEHDKQKAKAIVLALLATNLEIQFTGSKADSGGLYLLLLQEKHPELTPRQIIAQYIDTFDVSNCMSVLACPCYASRDVAASYEKNIPTNQTSDANDCVLTILPYGDKIRSNYANAHTLLDHQRPLCSFSVPVAHQSFKDMPLFSQQNLMDAWALRSTEPFKTRIRHVVAKIAKDYELYIDIRIEAKLSIEEVFDNIESRAFLEEPEKLDIKKRLFDALGGSWSRATDTMDEYNTFRCLVEKPKWLQNPFGEKYRQHMVGEGALIQLGPSELSIGIVESCISQGFNPFVHQDDMYFILSKIENPIDEFALKAIFLNQKLMAGFSKEGTRLMSLYDRIFHHENTKNMPMPSKQEMLNLLRISIVKMHHHSAFELEQVCLNKQSTY